MSASGRLHERRIVRLARRSGSRVHYGAPRLRETRSGRTGFTDEAAIGRGSLWSVARPGGLGGAAPRIAVAARDAIRVRRTPAKDPDGEGDVWGHKSDLPGPQRETVTFVGGPWDGRVGRYVDVGGHADMAAPGGRYRFEQVNRERAETLYVFRHEFDSAIS